MTTEKEIAQAIESLNRKGFRLTDWHIPKEGKARVIIEGTATPDIAKELDYLTRKC